MRSFFILITLIGGLLTTSHAQQYDDWQIFQSPEGYNDLLETDQHLWLATDAGVIRVDKISMALTYFNRNNTNLPSSHIQSLSRASNGDIWIGTYDMILARFDDGQWADILYPAQALNLDPEEAELYDFEVIDTENIWIGNKFGVARKHNGNWQLYDNLSTDSFLQHTWSLEVVDDRVYATSFFQYMFDGNDWHNLSDSTDLFFYGESTSLVDNSERFWVINHGHIAAVHDGENLQMYRTTDATQWSPSPPSSIRMLFQDGDDKMTVVASDQTVYKLENQVWVKQADELTNNPELYIEGYYVDQEARHWYTADNQLYRQSGALNSVSLSEFGLNSNQIISIKSDNEGWVYPLVAQGKSLQRYRAGEWQQIDIPQLEAFNYAQIFDLNFDGPSPIAAATTQGLFLYDGNEWTQHTIMASNNIPIYFNQVIYDGQKYYLNSSSGYYTFDGNEFIHYNSSNSGFTNDQVHFMAIDQEQALWILTGISEVWRLKDGEWTSYLDESALLGAYGRFEVGPDNTIWLPNWSLQGVAQYNDGEWTLINASNSSLSNTRVHQVSALSDGTTFFAQETGVAIYDGNDWQTIPIEAIPINFVQHIRLEATENGDLWLGSNDEGLVVGLAERPVATHNLQQQTKWTLFPNPSQEAVTISWDMPQNTQVSLRLLNVQGQVIQETSLGRLAAGEQQHQLAVNTLPSGIYFIDLIIDNQHAVRRLIKK